MSAQRLARVQQVERIELLSKADFRNNYLAAPRPVLIAGGVRHWPAVRQWTLESLAGKLGERPVIVGMSSDGVFNYDLEVSRIHYVSMPFSAAAARLRDPQEGEIAYIMQRTIELELPELVDDIPPPPLLSGELCWPHFWAGGAGVSTPLHWDNLQNLFGQVVGRKRFLLAAPGEFDRLYPYPGSARYSHISYANPDEPEQWPLLHDASWLECIVEPGDLLYIPAFWWHQVRSLDVAISVNYWWVPWLSHCLVPAFLRSVQGSFASDRFAGVSSPVTTFPGGALGAARFCLRRDQPRFSVLFASKFLEDTVRQRSVERGVPIEESGAPRDLRVLVSDLDAGDAWPDDPRAFFPAYEQQIEAALGGGYDDPFDPVVAGEFLAQVTAVTGALQQGDQVRMRKRDG